MRKLLFWGLLLCCCCYHHGRVDVNRKVSPVLKRRMVKVNSSSNKIKVLVKTKPMKRRILEKELKKMDIPYETIGKAKFTAILNRGQINRLIKRDFVVYIDLSQIRKFK